MKDNKINCEVVNCRIVGIDKLYYKNQLREFCNFFNDKKITSIHFGAFSFAFHDKRHCVPLQKNFTNKWEMLGFICGFNQAKEKGQYTEFGKWLK